MRDGYCNSYDDSMKAECDVKDKSCIKMVDDGKIMRLCGNPDKSLSNECKETDDGEICACDTDLCNESNSHQATVIIFLISFLILI
mgnify:CR=1 FL=1